MIRLYRRFLSKFISRSPALDIPWTQDCSKVRFDNFGESSESLCHFLFYSSSIYYDDKLLGYFYGRCLGFRGATNCVCRIGGERIKFRNVGKNIRATNVRTHESVLIKVPNRFANLTNGRIAVCLPDHSEMIMERPKFISMSQVGLPAYSRMSFEDGVFVRLLLYGRGSRDSEKARNECFNKAIHPDDIEKLPLVRPRISLSMLLAVAMYFRMYGNTRWLI